MTYVAKKCKILEEHYKNGWVLWALSAKNSSQKQFKKSAN